MTKKVISHSPGALDIDGKKLILRSAETITHLDTRTDNSTQTTKVEEAIYTITEVKEDFIILEKQEKEKQEKRIVVKRGSSGKLEAVLIRDDDRAHGYLNSLNGEFRIETKYYASKGIDHDYGWKISATCSKATKMF